MDAPQPGLVVLGLGNLLFCDEGLGIYAMRFLADNYEFNPPIALVDGGTLGMNLLDYYQTYSRVLILDTISVDDQDQPGLVYRLPAESLQGLGSYRKTAHEVEVLQTLEMCALLGVATEVQIVAMVPEQIEQVLIGLSLSIQTALPDLIDTALCALKDWGVEVTVRPQARSLEQILQSYAALRYTA